MSKEIAGPVACLPLGDDKQLEPSLFGAPIVCVATSPNVPSGTIPAWSIGLRVFHSGSWVDANRSSSVWLRECITATCGYTTRDAVVGAPVTPSTVSSHAISLIWLPALMVYTARRERAADHHSRQQDDSDGSRT
jgi:hypothetical protein